MGAILRRSIIRFEWLKEPNKTNRVTSGGACILQCGCEGGKGHPVCAVPQVAVVQVKQRDARKQPGRNRNNVPPFSVFMISEDPS
jgi:hypothetical protein